MVFAFANVHVCVCAATPLRKSPRVPKPIAKVQGKPSDMSDGDSDAADHEEDPEDTDGAGGDADDEDGDEDVPARSKHRRKSRQKRGTSHCIIFFSPFDLVVFLPNGVLPSYFPVSPLKFQNALFD
jgi:hypothetical protein